MWDIPIDLGTNLIIKSRNHIWDFVFKDFKTDAKLLAKFSKIGEKIQSKKVYIYGCFATFIYNKNFSHSLLLYKKTEKNLQPLKVLSIVQIV